MRDAQNSDVLVAKVDLEGSRFSQVKALGFSISVALAVVIADQITKRWALDSLIPGSCDQAEACIDLVLGARFHLIFNTGAAFTQGSGFGPMLGVLAFFMSGFLLFLSSRRSDRLGSGLFGAIAGGAVGNLVDRIYRAEDGFLSGAVVDFVDLGWWPVFNLADAAIVIGVIGMIILSLVEGTPDSV